MILLPPIALLVLSGLKYRELMDPIIQHPAIPKLSVDIRPRSRLKKKHKILFENEDSTLIFDELAVVVCNTGVVCRKELFETYAAATLIHAKFPQMKRMADLAAGHGLLSWFLLVLDFYENNPGGVAENLCKGPHKRPRTVVCVDRRMPASADAIANAMIDRFPELEHRWSYIQSDLSAIEPDPSCLLTSVHACGTLTDCLVDMAIGDDTISDQCRHRKGVPLAVVPCCHTVKVQQGYKPHFYSGLHVDDVVALVEKRKSNQRHLKHEAVADVVDEIRCRTLRNAGFDVEEVMLPSSFTGRNRLLLGEPQNDRGKIYPGKPTDSSQDNKKNDFFFERKRETYQPGIRIPLADNEESINHCNSISGRDPARTRLFEQIPKHFSPSLVLSIWLGEASSANISIPIEEMLQLLADQCCSKVEVDGVQCTVKALGEVNVQPATGRRSQRFKFTYKSMKSNDNNVTRLSKNTAKMIHNFIRDKIVDNFGNDLLR